MSRYTFAVNKVTEMGAHEPQALKTVTVNAPNEEIARSMAREELRKLTPGVQRFHPAEVLDIKPDVEKEKAAGK
jgi:hypothetical protein